MAKELFTVQVEVTYDIVVYCERDQAQRIALGAISNERGNEDIDTFGPYPVKRSEDVPGKHWLDALPYTAPGDVGEEKTVGALLADLCASPVVTGEGR